MSETIALDTLSALVRESAVSGVQRHALLLRSDRLPPSLSSPQHLRTVREALTPLTLADRGRCHELPGGRVVVIWRGDAPRLLRQTLDSIDRVLQEDLFEAPALSQLIAYYDLPGDGSALIEAASAPVPADAPSASTYAEPAADPLRLQPLDSAALDRLEHSLASADITRFARRRPVCHSSSKGMLLAWEERTLSIPELIDAVAPGRDAKSDVWLFRRLTRVLDRRMLSILSDLQELRGAGPFSITLNVASVLSQEFLRFDAALPPGLRGKVVISFLPADIAADAGAFAFARNFARSRSYRVCLRAVSPPLLQLLDLRALELDFVQLIWSPEFKKLQQMPDLGHARWIVGRPCTEEAVEWGTQSGIGLFATNPTR